MTLEMFKKKPDIPPRPKIPTVEQIIEDIEESSANDVVFAKSLNADATSGIGTRSEGQNAEEVYQKVMDFVEVNTTLREMLEKLQNQSEALKISDLELKAMADDIRKQALEALQ